MFSQVIRASDWTEPIGDDCVWVWGGGREGTDLSRSSRSGQRYRSTCSSVGGSTWRPLWLDKAFDLAVGWSIWVEVPNRLTGL